MDVVIVAPQIAPNTGSIIRLCANAGARLHLVEPLGFSLGDRLLRRAGLDYHEHATVMVHDDVAAARGAATGRWLALTSRGSTRYDRVDYRADDVLVFGCEAAGLPDDVLAAIPAVDQLVIPMCPDNRSLNLANAVSIVVYEAWRQLGFVGAGTTAATTLESIAVVPGTTAVRPRS